METAKAALERKYQMELEKLDREIETKNAQQLILKRTINDVRKDTERTAKTDSIEPPPAKISTLFLRCF